MKLKVLLLFLISVIVTSKTMKAQVSGYINVGGDLTKYYPVTFSDSTGWIDNAATELEIGRSDLHRDASYRGSIIARFRFHTTNYGHGSNFIDADIRQTPSSSPAFVAGWKDATIANATRRIVIWLRGSTNYSYKCNYPVSPAVYDGIQNTLPFQEINGPAHTYKTAIDSYVNAYGMSYGNTAYFNGTGNNYFAGKVGIGVTNPTFAFHSAAYGNTGIAASLLWGEYYGAAVGVPHNTDSYYALHVVANVDSLGRSKTGGAKSLLFVRADGNVGIGTTAPQAKLAVNGDVFAKKIKVTQTGWPDFVFSPDYKMRSLPELERYIKENQHLPEIPTAAAIQKDGHDLGEMNKKLLQKVEELTLYLIELKKENNEMKQRIEKLEKSK